MGTWGAGPFSNDNALDWLSEHITQPLIAEIEQFTTMENPALESDLQIAYAALGTLNVLKSANIVPPEKDQIHRWERAFLRCYDEQIEGLAGGDSPFAQAWRAAITQEFEALKAWSQAFHRG